MKKFILAAISVLILIGMCPKNILAATNQSGNQVTVEYYEDGGLWDEDYQECRFAHVHTYRTASSCDVQCWGEGNLFCDPPEDLNGIYILTTSDGNPINLSPDHVDNVADIARQVIHDFYELPGNANESTTGSQTHNFIYDNQAFYRTVSWSATNSATSTIIVDIIIAP